MRSWRMYPYVFVSLGCVICLSFDPIKFERDSQLFFPQEGKKGVVLFFICLMYGGGGLSLPWGTESHNMVLTYQHAILVSKLEESTTNVLQVYFVESKVCQEKC